MKQGDSLQIERLRSGLEVPSDRDHAIVEEITKAMKARADNST